MADELRNSAESGHQVATTRRQLSIPLIIVSPGGEKGPRNETNAQLQRDLVTLSNRGCQVIAEESGHGIGNQPELVVEAIRDVLSALKRPNGKPGC
jgi:hypothetical protein